MALSMAAGDFRLESLLLAELNDRTRDLFADVTALSCGMSLLVFLNEHSNSYSTVDAIAFRLGESPERVESSLKGLAEHGLAKRMDVGPTLWGLTTDPTLRETAEDLIGWKNRWQARLAKVERAILGHGENPADCDAAANGTCRDQSDCWRCASFLYAAMARLQHD